MVLGTCRDLLARFDGRAPDDIEALLTLKGVGRKTANLVVTQGLNKPGTCVDVHAHRILNRLGYVKTGTPAPAATRPDRTCGSREPSGLAAQAA